MAVNEKPKLLLLDDDLDFINYIKVEVEKIGIEVYAYQDVASFLRNIRATHFNLCLVDLNLEQRKDMGHHVIKFLREKFGHDLPIIMVSAYGNLEDIQKAKDEGANDYLPKPIDVDILYPKLSLYYDLPILEEYSPYKGRVPQSLQSIDLEISLELISISEYGMVLRSNIFINSGTMIKIESDLMKQIFGDRPLPIFTVTKSESIPQQGHHCHVAFENSDYQYESAIRKWIFQQKYLRGATSNEVDPNKN